MAGIGRIQYDRYFAIPSEYPLHCLYTVHYGHSYVHDNKITAGAVRWQEGLDLESGQGEPVGFGAVFVDCPSYESGLPDGY